MRNSFKIILFIVCILIGGITKTYARTIENGQLIGYGLTNKDDKQYGVIKILETDTVYLVYEIDGSQYCDYIFTMLTNPVFWGNKTDDRWYIVCKDDEEFEQNEKPHYEIVRITWRE